MNVEQEIVIITGSSGYIGSNLAKNLATTYKIIGLDQGIPSQQIPGVEYYSINIASEDDVNKVLQSIRDKYGNHIHSVVHLVAYYSFSGEKSPMYEQITIKGTEFLLTHLNRLFEVEQFIFSSTMLVHAPTEPGVKIHEESKLNPRWAYPESKVDAENTIALHRKNIPVVNLRIAGVYDDSCHSIPLSQHIARIYECQFSSMLFPGDASHGQTFIHLQDLITAFKLLIEKRATLPSVETLILGEENVTTYKELQHTIGRLTNDISWPTIRVPKMFARSGAFMLGKMPLIREPFIKPWMIDFADDHYDVDLTKVRNQLSWTPRRNLFNLIPGMIAKLKADPDKWYQEHKIKKPTLKLLNTISPDIRQKYWTAACMNVFLGLWLLANPFTFGPLPQVEFWNDVIVGFLVMVISLISLLPPLRWLRWVNASIASWLMFAPLVFWSESAAIYSNDTLLAGLILLISAYTPSEVSEADKSEVPTGWSYNPSTWKQRLPIMMLAFTGFLMARYLAAFQLGHVANVWDPFFENGSEVILTSDISKAFPVSDAGLGALSYLLDVIAAAIGDRNRWRTMPWMVVLFGLFIIPTGVTSITLVMLQPIGVGAWCTICLFTALIMLIMVPPSIDEVVATAQFLRRSTKAGKPFWRTFWLGDREEKAVRIPESQEGRSHAGVMVSSIIGAWLLFVPWMFEIREAAANNIYIVSALIITFSVIAYSDVSRIVRLANIPMGIWLAVSCWFFEGSSFLANGNLLGLGIILVIISLPRGKVVEHFGTFDPWVRMKPNQLWRKILMIFVG